MIRYKRDRIVDDLLTYVEEERLKSPDDGSSRELRPNEIVIERLAKLGWEEKVLAYCSRLPPSHLSPMARTSEILQMMPSDDARHRFPLEPLRVLRPRDYLNYFRLAQKIRNEHGVRRKNSPTNCYKSFGDIISSEQDIGRNSYFVFMLQCIDLKLVGLTHAHRMYKLVFSFFELDALQDAMGTLEAQSREANHNLLFYDYVAAFNRLANESSHKGTPHGVK